MPTAEKHGAFWFGRSCDDGWMLVFERYEPAVDLLGAVFLKAGLYKAVVFEKIKDRQLRLPAWSERRPESLFETQEDAVAHIDALLTLASQA